jgi:hypothetical protein
MDSVQAMQVRDTATAISPFMSARRIRRFWTCVGNPEMIHKQQYSAGIRSA